MIPLSEANDTNASLGSTQQVPESINQMLWVQHGARLQINPNDNRMALPAF
jgi:hypothetical protein